MFTTKTPKSQKLSEQSDDVISLFTETKEKLEYLNQQADLEEESLNARVAQLNSELNALATTRERNSRVVANINKIFE